MVTQVVRMMLAYNVRKISSQAFKEMFTNVIKRCLLTYEKNFYLHYTNNTYSRTKTKDYSHYQYDGSS